MHSAHRRSLCDELCQLYDVIYKTYILHYIVGKVRHKTNACDSIWNRCESVLDQEGKRYIHLANVETRLTVGKRLFQNN